MVYIYASCYIEIASPYQAGTSIEFLSASAPVSTKRGPVRPSVTGQPLTRCENASASVLAACQKVEMQEAVAQKGFSWQGWDEPALESRNAQASRKDSSTSGNWQEEVVETSRRPPQAWWRAYLLLFVLLVAGYRPSDSDDSQSFSVLLSLDSCYSADTSDSTAIFP